MQEIIIPCKEKAIKFNLEETDLVLDHAIYAKALEYLLRKENQELNTFINLRMGGFHTTCIFLGVIGKRFGDGGLRDLAVEAGIIGQGNVDQALKSKTLQQCHSYPYHYFRGHNAQKGLITLWNSYIKKRSFILGRASQVA